MDAYTQIFETLDLEKTAPLEGLGATIGLPLEDQRDTLRASLPVLSLDEAGAQFQLSSEIGRGGMGVVHLAQQPALGREVAIKTVNSDINSKSANLALLQEARAMGLVEHPNVPPVHLIGQDTNGRPIIVMKRIAGKTWESFLNGENPVPGEPFEFHLNTAIGVCRAVEFAHSKGILHRDIKPENVMIGEFGEVYLLDWGLAVTTQSSLKNVPLASEANAVVGTPVYMAPEMTIGSGQGLGHHTDIFLLGATIFHALTGKPPNQGKTFFEVLSFSYTGGARAYPESFPDEMRAICERAMAKEPTERFDSVEDLRLALADFLTHRSSIFLTDAAEEKFSALKSATPDAEFESRFLEIRFGFMSALDIWEQNLHAASLLDELLVWRVEHDLETGDLKSAKRYVAEMKSPTSELVGRVDEAWKSFEKEQTELAQMAYDYDVKVSVRFRRVVIGVLALAMASSPFFIQLLEDWNPPEALAQVSRDPVTLISNLTGLVFLPVLIGGLKFTYRFYKDHKATRIFIKAMLAMYVMGMGARSTSLRDEVPLHIAAAAETAIYSVGLVMLAMAVDRRFGLPSFLYAITAICLVFSAGIELYVYAYGSTAACLGFLAYDKYLEKNPDFVLNQALGLERKPD